MLEDVKPKPETESEQPNLQENLPKPVEPKPAEQLTPSPPLQVQPPTAEPKQKEKTPPKEKEPDCPTEASGFDYDSVDYDKLIKQQSQRI